ncbi:MAG: hypothetical protein ACO3XZ_07515, partial [Ilumatobacteraceae bacterium]
MRKENGTNLGTGNKKLTANVCCVDAHRHQFLIEERARTEHLRASHESWKRVRPLRGSVTKKSP